MIYEFLRPKPLRLEYHWIKADQTIVGSYFLQWVFRIRNYPLFQEAVGLARICVVFCVLEDNVRMLYTTLHTTYVSSFTVKTTSNYDRV